MNRNKHQRVQVTHRLHLKALVGAVSIGMIAATFGLSAPAAMAAAPPAPFFNGFENATDVATYPGPSTQAMFDVNRVPSGTDGITAASGTYFAEAAQNPNGGPLIQLTRQGGYSFTFPAGGYTTSAQIYLDMSQNSVLGTDTRFDWSSAINSTTGFQRDFIWNVGTDPLNTGQFAISASNNAPGWPSNPGRNPTFVNTTGWYTFQSKFYDNGSGVLAVDMNAFAPGQNPATDTPIYHETLSDPSDLISTTGGNRYQWLVDNGFTNLAVDNITRSGQCTTVCYADSATGNDANSGVSPTEAKKTIQAAVNTVNVGGTVIAAAGTYDELVTVNKSITLQGAQAGVDARGRSGSESVVEGNAGTTSFYVTASGVTIDGFTVQNQTNGNQFGAGIVLGSGTSQSTVVNNIVTSNIVGLFLANNSTTAQTLIRHNVFSNNNNTGPSSGTGIYTDQYVAGGTVSDVLIQANSFTGQTDSGIGFSSTSATAPDTNITISGNTFDGNGRGLYAFNLTNSTITANTFENATSSATADVRIFEGDNNLSIDHNILENGAGRAYRASNASTGSPDPTAIHLNRNSITGYTGPASTVQNDATPQLDGTCNWWGSAAGPGAPASTVSSNVDASTWLASTDLTGPCVNYTFLGYGAPLPKTKLSASNSTIPVKFMLGDANGNPLPASIASTLVTRVTLTGPSPTFDPSAPILTSIEPCPYNTTSGMFKCNLAKPRTVTIGAQWYWIRTTVKIGNTYVQPTNFGGAVNPEPVSFKK